MLVISFPQDLREKYGIPDLRRAARFRYASVTPLEVGLHHDNVKIGGMDDCCILLFC